jgi:hypothetical protein
MALFYEIREVPGIKKRPSTSELLDWLKLLESESVKADTLRRERGLPPMYGALLKSEQDVTMTEHAFAQNPKRGRS